MKDLLILFIVLNIVNVIIQTVKSIATIKCGKGMAAIVNAVAYGFYTVVTIYMLCDLSLFLKAGIVALCNLIGVYVVKYFEEKARKDKLWKVELTVKADQTYPLKAELDGLELSYKYFEGIGKHTEFNVYCATQKDSAFVKELVKKYQAKFFVTESKVL